MSIAFAYLIYGATLALATCFVVALLCAEFQRIRENARDRREWLELRRRREFDDAMRREQLR